MKHDEELEDLKRNPKFQELMELLREHPSDKVMDLLDQLILLPPKPPKIGKKYVVQKQGVNAMIDPALMDLLEETRQSMGISMSRMVECCVWEYFQRPALSFERPEDKEEAKIT